MAEGDQSYPCPHCGALNSGNVFQVRRGLKCTSCGTGYIPIKIEGRGFRQKESPLFMWIMLAVLAVLVVVFGIISIWLMLALIAVALLAGILFWLSRSGT